jgi:hypothetical protein
MGVQKEEKTVIIVFTTVMLSVITSTIVTGILIYILKKAIENGLDTHFKLTPEESKAVIAEQFRQLATLNQDQCPPLKAIGQFSYRCRNALMAILKTSDENPQQDFISMFNRFKHYYLALEELIFEHHTLECRRAI